MKSQDSTVLITRNRAVTKHEPRIAQVIRLGGRKVPSRLAVKSRVAMRSMLLNRIGEVEARIQPAALGRALSDDARERGL